MPKNPQIDLLEADCAACGIEGLNARGKVFTAIAIATFILGIVSVYFSFAQTEFLYVVLYSALSIILVFGGVLMILVRNKYGFVE